MASTCDFVIKEGSKDIPVAITIPRDAKVGVILAHGAGGDMHSGHLPDTASALSEAGCAVVRFSVKPPVLATRVKAMKAVLSHAASMPELQSIAAWLLAGHSMGGRVAVQVASESEKCDIPHQVIGCLLFSYPLHPPGKPDQLRDVPLCDLQLPVMFIRGTNDPFSTEGRFQQVKERMASSLLQVYEVDGGDHSLKVKGGKVRCQEELKGVHNAACKFADECILKNAGDTGAKGGRTDRTAAKEQGKGVGDRGREKGGGELGSRDEHQAGKKATQRKGGKGKQGQLHEKGQEEKTKKRKGGSSHGNGNNRARETREAVEKVGREGRGRRGAAVASVRRPTQGKAKPVTRVENQEAGGGGSKEQTPGGSKRNASNASKRLAGPSSNRGGKRHKSNTAGRDR